MCDIKNLKDLIAPYIEPGGSYVGYVAKRAVAPGDNYGSLVLDVDIKCKNKNNEIQTLRLIAKKIPETDFLRQLFKIQLSFQRELNFYGSVIDTLVDFQKQLGMTLLSDIFPRYYAGRLNANGDTNVVDGDGVILLENLKVEGYKICERTTGFGLDVAKFLLRDLAVFHAVPIAMKLTCPEQFEKKVLPHLSTFDIFTHMEEKNKDRTLKQIYDIINENHVCAHYIDRITNVLNNYDSSQYSEPFATICHNSYWVNNIMLKIERGKPMSGKVLDFQVVDYGSPGRDLVFFIFGSIQPNLIDAYYEEFIRTYYIEFIRTLQDFNCDINPFTYRAFLEQMDVAAKRSQLLHLLFMFQPICAETKYTKETKDIFDADDMPKPTKLQKERIWFTIQQFAKRNWM